MADAFAAAFAEAATSERGVFLGILASQQRAGMIAHDGFTGGRLEDGHEADRLLFAADGIPRHPDAVRRPELGRAIVVLELLGRENVLPIGVHGSFIGALVRTLGGSFLVCVREDGHFAFRLHGLVRAIVEVDAAAEPAGGFLAGPIDHRLAPNDHHPRRIVGRLLAFFPLPAQHVPGAVLQRVGLIAKCLAAGGAAQQQGSHQRTYPDSSKRCSRSECRGLLATVSLVA